MKIFLSNISNNEIIPDENFPDYGMCVYTCSIGSELPPYKQFLNQPCTGLRLVHGWFLKIDLLWIVSMLVCVRAQGY